MLVMDVRFLQTFLDLHHAACASTHMSGMRPVDSRFLLYVQILVKLVQRRFTELNRKAARPCMSACDCEWLLTPGPG